MNFLRRILDSQHKNFTGEYINREGILSKRTYSIFVRDLDKSVKTNINPTGELLWENGLYKGDRPFVNSGLRTIDANKLYDFISNIIIDGEALGKLYEIGNWYDRKWNIQICKRIMGNR